MESGHMIVYRGFQVSLGVMQREYIPVATKGLNDLEITRGMLLRPPVSIEAEYAWYDSMPERKADDIFAILLHGENGGEYRYIGHTGLHGVTWPSGFAKSGSVIVDTECLGKGYGSEAKMLLLRHAFYTRGLRKVISEVKAFNGQSYGHLIRCGFRPIGIYRSHHFDNGTYVDEIILEVFRFDFDPIWRKYQELKKVPSLTDEQKFLMKQKLCS